MNDGLADRLDAIVAGSILARAEHHAALGSTNDRAAELGRDGGPLPALVTAERQQSGRGRGGNRWFSSGGALTFSVVYDRDALGLTPERLPLVALATGLAVRAAVHNTLSAASRPPDAAVPLVKWPNDVLVGDRKIAGILVEESAGRVVVGIGLNVNNDFTGAPADVEARATSIRSLLDQSVDRADVLARVLGAMSDQFARLVEAGDDLARRWGDQCALTGRAVRIRVHDRIVEGVCEGIDPSGALLVRSGNAVERVLSGVVESYGGAAS